MDNFLTEYLPNHKLYKLLKRVTEGDPLAIEELYRDYSKFIYWHIMNYTDDKDIGEDILQEVFIKIYMLDSKNLPRRGATSWLIRVVHNTAVTYLTKLTVKAEGIGYDEMESVVPSPEESIVSAEYVAQMIDALDEDTQKIVLLRQQGYSFLEISERLRKNPSTVRSRYSRVMGKLMSWMGKQNEKTDT